MSRSFRKHPFIGNTTAESEKQDKRIAAGKIRVLSRARLAKADDTPVDYRESGHGSWEFSKDGKKYFDMTKISHVHGVHYARKLMGK